LSVLIPQQYWSKSVIATQKSTLAQKGTKMNLLYFEFLSLRCVEFFVRSLLDL